MFDQYLTRVSKWRQALPEVLAAMAAHRGSAELQADLLRLLGFLASLAANKVCFPPPFPAILTNSTILTDLFAHFDSF